MHINIEESGTNVKVVIDGVVKSIADSQNIQDAVGTLNKEQQVTIVFTDSFSLTSTVIGFLLKKIQKDGYKIALEIHDTRLWDLLGHLSLTGPLNAKKV